VGEGCGWGGARCLGGCEGGFGGGAGGWGGVFEGRRGQRGLWMMGEVL